MSEPSKLIDFIKKVRNFKTKEEEIKIVNEELQNIIVFIKKEDRVYLHRSIGKLIFIFFLGYDVKTLAPEAVKLLINKDIVSKKLAYTALNVIIHDKDQLLLASNFVKNDLEQNFNHFFINYLTCLNFLANTATIDVYANNELLVSNLKNNQVESIRSKYLIIQAKFSRLANNPNVTSRKTYQTILINEYLSNLVVDSLNTVNIIKQKLDILLTVEEFESVENEDSIKKIKFHDLLTYIIVHENNSNNYRLILSLLKCLMKFKVNCNTDDFINNVLKFLESTASNSGVLLYAIYICIVNLVYMFDIKQLQKSIFKQINQVLLVTSNDIFTKQLLITLIKWSKEITLEYLNIMNDCIKAKTETNEKLRSLYCELMFQYDIELIDSKQLANYQNDSLEYIIQQFEKGKDKSLYKIFYIRNIQVDQEEIINKLLKSGNLYNTVIKHFSIDKSENNKWKESNYLLILYLIKYYSNKLIGDVPELGNEYIKPNEKIVKKDEMSELFDTIENKNIKIDEDENQIIDENNDLEKGLYDKETIQSILIIYFKFFEKINNYNYVYNVLFKLITYLNFMCKNLEFDHKIYYDYIAKNKVILQSPQLTSFINESYAIATLNISLNNNLIKLESYNLNNKVIQDIYELYCPHLNSKKYVAEENNVIEEKDDFFDSILDFSQFNSDVKPKTETNENEQIIDFNQFSQEGNMLDLFGSSTGNDYNTSNLIMQIDDAKGFDSFNFNFDQGQDQGQTDATSSNHNHDAFQFNDFINTNTNINTNEKISTANDDFTSFKF